jgi:hypothetical protein
MPSKQRVIIVHGWGKGPTTGWFSAVKKRLEARGFEVVVPAMPNKDAPKMGAWIKTLSEIVGTPDEQTFLIGHSIGCQTIFRYLASLKKNECIGGVLSVAGWFSLTGLRTQEERRLAKPWLETPISFEDVKKHASKIVALLSDNDSFVPLEAHRQIYKEKLNAQVILTHGQGHIGRAMYAGDVEKAFLKLQKISH